MRFFLNDNVLNLFRKVAKNEVFQQISQIAKKKKHNLTF